VGIHNSRGSGSAEDSVLRFRLGDALASDPAPWPRGVQTPLKKRRHERRDLNRETEAKAKFSSKRVITSRLDGKR